MAFAIGNTRRAFFSGFLASGGSAVGYHAVQIADTIADALGANYFNAAYAQYAVGDVLLLAASDGFATLRVTASSSAGVTVVGDSGVGVSSASAAKAAIQRFTFTMSLANIADGDLVTNYVPGFAGKILGIHAFAAKAATTAAKAATLTPKIGATNTTGGALALTSANMTPQGNKVDGSAITAANVFTATDTIGIVASSTTAFAEGVVIVVVDLENTDLKNALV